MLNSVTLIGRAGRDPESRSTTNGDQVTNLSIATSRKWKDQGGQQREETEWHALVAFGRTGEVMAKYVQKGDLVTVQGRIQTRSWDDKKTGEKRYKTEIVVDRLTLMPKATPTNSTQGGDIPFLVAIPYIVACLSQVVV